MRGILTLLLLVAVANAAIDQSYVQTVSRDGTSAMEKSMDVSMFSVLSAPVLRQMADYCSAQKMDCGVDANASKVMITEKLAPGTYYAYSVDYGLPYITYTLTAGQLPNDLFSSDLDRMMSVINASPSASAVKPLDLTDKAGNAAALPILRRLNANLTYTVNMPAPVVEASAGNATGVISGSSATFDLISVMENGKAVTVRSQELNTAYIVPLGAAIVIVALALAFFQTKPAPKKAAAKKKK